MCPEGGMTVQMAIIFYVMLRWSGGWKAERGEVVVDGGADGMRIQDGCGWVMRLWDANGV